MADPEHLERLPALEIGTTEAIQKHYARHIVLSKPVSQRKLDFEHSRPRWLRELLAEVTGVFFYTYPGLAATVTLTITQANPAYSSILQIGFALALGIAFAIITCAPTSGGHFNPAVTICLAIWQGFAWKKVPYYILAQCLGAFIATLVVVGQYWEQLSAFAEASQAAGRGLVYSGGPASALCSIPLPTQTNLGYLFMIEFFVCSYVGIVIWAVIDPANPFISPSSAPFVIGLAYASVVWGFADVTISTNLARDLGTRSVAAIFYGREVFTYHNYSWISLLVNIPATVLATGYYELLMRDSLQKIGKGAAMHENGEDGLALHLTKSGISRDRSLQTSGEKFERGEM